MTEIVCRGLSDKQIIIILGLGIAAYAAFVSIYNSASGITNDIAACTQSNSELAHKRDVQFIVMIVISCLAIVLGLFLSVWIKKSCWVFLPLALTVMGLLALVYTIGIKANDKVQLGLSIALFVLFLIYGFSVGLTGCHEKTKVLKGFSVYN